MKKESCNLFFCENIRNIDKKFFYSWVRRRVKFAKFTRSFMKRITKNSVNEYCYHVNIMKYTQIHGERKDRDEKDQ